MRIGCVIQARINSTRLPNKANMDIGGWPMVRHVEERLRAFNPIVAWAHNYPHLDEMDVLSRYMECARANGLDIIMRVTSDCPLIDPEECDKVFQRFVARGCYAANDLLKTYPKGLGCEVMSRDELKHAHAGTKSAKGREHVTGSIRAALGDKYSANVLCPFLGCEGINLSVDTQDDLDLVRKIDALLPAGDGKYRLENTLEAYKRVKSQDGAN